MQSIGIDIGYSAVKLVLMDETTTVRFAGYRLHNGDAGRALRGLMDEAAAGFPPLQIGWGAVTGSGGDRFGRSAGIDRINQVRALVEGAGAAAPEARAVVEIGGQGAKYVTGLDTGDRSRIGIAMSAGCAAGTGSFLEAQVARLGLALEDYSSLAAQAASVPRIAGRCSVFARTDITHHQQEGVPVADILMGLAYALVRNLRIAVLCKLPQQTPLLLAGGVALNRAIRLALQDLLKLAPDELIVPPEAACIAALGAARLAMSERMRIADPGIGEVKWTEAQAEEVPPSRPLSALASFGSGDSRLKHETVAVPAGRLDGYLGVDVGSTSTNLVFADPAGRIVAFRYLRTLGDPAAAVRRGLASLHEAYGDRLRVLGAATTGSGRYLTGRLIGADAVKDEITAQARAAVALDPAVDTIFEIGGQDSKYIRIVNGAVADFQMNKVCAAGTGSFVEEQAKKFDIPLDRIGAMALAGDRPVDLGERCTVFMEAGIAAHLGRGRRREDITAGICYAVARNYLHRVVGNKPIGERIFFQGGLAFNQGVVNALRALTGKKIVVPPFFSVTGAYGAALIAREAVAGRATRFRGFAPEAERLAPAAPRRTAEPPPSAFAQSVDALIFEGYREKLDPNKQTVGIPRALFTFGMFSLFHRFFTVLGFNVLLSAASSERTIALGQAHALDETCYPVKLINGHVAELVRRQVDYIFFPDLHSVDHPGSPARKNYGCAYMQLAFKIVNRAMDLGGRRIGLLAPSIAFSLGRTFMMESFARLGRQLDRTRQETFQALEQGMDAYRDFEARLAAAGRAALDRLDPTRKAFVMISKIYGIADPVLNMGIADRLMEMGYPVLPFYFMPEGDLSREHPNMYWPFGQHILEPAPFIREHPNLYAVLLTHHGCGPDSVLTHYFREAMKDKPYLHIEVDEHASRVGMLTRVEAFVESLRCRDVPQAEPVGAYRARIVHRDENLAGRVGWLEKETTVCLPHLYPYAQLGAALLQARGFAAEVLPITDPAALDLGRALTVAEESFSLTALMGDVLKRCRSGNGARYAFLVPRTEGAEVDGQYSRMLRLKLDEEGFGEAAVVSPFLEDLPDLAHADRQALFLALLAGDVVRAAPTAQRDRHLEQLVALARQGRLDIETLAVVATDIARAEMPPGKRILAVGEPLVLYNDGLNNFIFQAIENQGHRVVWAPLAETLWLFWRDGAAQGGRAERHRPLLDALAGDMAYVAQCLGPRSPFERDPESLADRADRSVGYYAGAFGRYRAAKVLVDPARIDGIVTVSGIYENTGVSLNVLHPAFAGSGAKPALNLTFDGHPNANDANRLEAFIAYL